MTTFENDEQRIAALTAWHDAAQRSIMRLAGDRDALLRLARLLRESADTETRQLIDAALTSLLTVEAQL